MNQLSAVGYIGLGDIGKPSAVRLLDGPWTTYVYDVVEDAVAELEKLGAKGCSSPAELAAACQHIGICVRDESQVQALLYGEQGLFANAAPGTVIAIHSTLACSVLKLWAGDAEAAGVRLIDAAITGGRQGAENGTLCYMVGGSAADVERAKPVFETSAERIVHAGDLGAGMLLKLCNNLITYAEFLAMSEACRLAEAGGLSINVLREVGLSNGVVNESMHRFVENRNAISAKASEQDMETYFGPFGRLGEKDLDCALASARDLGVELPSTERLREVVYDLFMNKA
ncbi:NAD(P)-dependent oxidoreductase [Parahaliea sp. F7430]|uniref:NAD(P)-dependent oxidoreductase n=1 Tax=Sediminihaliea albiluteola TaxID=2758564 RepID=A0A7W2YK17_9GAMM|nr:NAD(P)-dependent oxidoreductase [Sediminihaliea albiluteola]MBA6413692.1 NAD(P)-dependent oxidoreductase [Sediminihaliea albiluteola]